MKTISKSFRPAWMGLTLLSLLLSSCFNQPRVLTEEEFGTAVAATLNAAFSQTPPSPTRPPSQTPTATVTALPTQELRPSSTPLPTHTPAPSITVRPSATLTPAPPTQTPTPVVGLILEDDFSEQTGWLERVGDGFVLEHRDEAYRMTINRISGIIYSVRLGERYQVADIHLEVDMVLSDGPENGYSGVICRYVDDNNYYAMVFGSDGFYAIARMLNGSFTFLNRGKNLTGVIHGPGFINRIAADCKGKNLSLYANGKLLAQATDAAIQSGGFGLVVGTRPNPGAAITFDNFLASQPYTTPTPRPSPTP
jgi:hypothetical protein